MALLVPSSAFAEGGKAIAGAPPVVYGQQEFGNTASGQFLEGSCGTGLFGAGDGWRSYWSLPVTAGDLVTINWEGTPGTELKLMPPGTTDYTLFQANPIVSEGLSSNLKSQAHYTVPLSGVMPLYFRMCSDYGTAGPYSFTVTAQRGLSTALTPATSVYPNSIVTGTASLVDGTPLPDGVGFSLEAKWHTGSAIFYAGTVGGTLSFQLALPPETAGKPLRLTITRAEDTGYQAAKSASMKVTVAEAPTPRPLRCRRGFRKRKVQGTVRCVRVKRHHRHRHHHGR